MRLPWLLCSLAVVVVGGETTLEFVHVFFRHGNRTPELKSSYPNDPHNSTTFSPMGWGQLTNDGKLRAHKLGKLLRTRYGDFLGDIYSPEMVETHTTDFDRTKMSALLVLSGLFPPAESQRWHAEIPWLPIPYSMDKDAVDYVLRRPLWYCPAYAEELERVMSGEAVARTVKQHEEMLKYLEEHSGKKVRCLYDVFQLFQTLNAEAAMNLTLPEWTAKYYPVEMAKLATEQCVLENSNSILKRLNGGRSLQKAIENMQLKIGGSLPSRKIHLYSGHENNVINILAALDAFQPHVPKYSSAVILELHRDEKAHAVKVFYARDVDAEPEAVAAPGCDVLCPFDKFLDATKPHVPINYTAECRARINLQ